MNIEIEWHTPIKLTKSKTVLVGPSSIPEDIPEDPGVYFFSRRFGNRFSPFYIGETMDIRGRLRSHLQDIKIYHVLEGHKAASIDVGQGTRYFHYGILRKKSKQDPKKCIQIVERLMIRQALDQGIVILNKKLTKFKTDNIEFTGRAEGRGLYDRTYSPEARKK